MKHSMILTQKQSTLLQELERVSREAAARTSAALNGILGGYSGDIVGEVSNVNVKGNALTFEDEQVATAAPTQQLTEADVVEAVSKLCEE